MIQRIEQLKSENLWSFKQIKPHVPPTRNKTQWDLVLESAVWMAEDFRQERKWKMAMAYQFAHWVKEWHEAIDKSALCVKVMSSKVASLEKGIEYGIR